MATKYIIYKRYEKRVGKGQLPDIETRYLAEMPPNLELTENYEEAIRFDEEEDKEIAYMTWMDYKPLGG